MELIHPFTCIVSGPTGCGKSVFVSKLIKENVVRPNPDRIVWCYGEYQKLYKTLPLVEFVQGLKQDFNPEQNNLLIIDDLMSENDKAIANLFTKGSYHKNISVIYRVGQKNVTTFYILTIFKITKIFVSFSEISTTKH